jgi:hypothetical protein
METGARSINLRSSQSVAGAGKGTKRPGRGRVVRRDCAACGGGERPVLMSARRQGEGEASGRNSWGRQEKDKAPTKASRF